VLNLANSISKYYEDNYYIRLHNKMTVETVVLLSKGEISSKKVKVEYSLEDMDTTSLRGKAIYEQIKDYVMEHSALNVSSLYIAQIKRKCGLEIGDHYNISEKKNQKIPKCPPDKEKAIIEAHRALGMIA